MHGTNNVGACCEPEEFGVLAQQAHARLLLERLNSVDTSTRRAELTSAVLATPVDWHETQETAESTELDAGEYYHAVQHKLPT